MVEINLDNSKVKIEDGTSEWSPRNKEAIKRGREAEE
jgi:hypothetical protein